ncbi:Rv3235 family protein [Gordonia sp. CPCC 206044]|uniref:Rv3235 family protein n=1 Tax=Gordonia sp. CPCC 206044 TaxID=3140793 RepID=UPI003AF3761C
MEPDAVALRPILMETPRVLIRPAPPYEPRALVADTSRPAGVAVDPRTACRDRATESADRAADVAVRARRAAALERATVDARRFAIGTLTLLLEVLDRRRNVNQLEPALAAGLFDQISVLARASGQARSGPSSASTGRDNSASLRRVHIQMWGPGAAEVFGTYRRGERVRAFAGRIEQLPRRVRSVPGGRRAGLARTVEYRWQLVAFSVA